MLRPAMSYRVFAALLALLSAGLLVAASLLPEFESGGVGTAPLDPERVGSVAILIGLLIHVGLILLPALMLLMGDGPSSAGGILLGAGVLGLSLRLVRMFQLAEVPGVDAAVGSWIDALAEGLSLTAGAVALIGLRRDSAPLEDPDVLEQEEIGSETVPPPGD